jgi:uncharacterized tellurite resistance protein B-like protein
MLDLLRQIIGPDRPDDQPPRETQVRLAAAVLLVEVAAADQAFDDREAQAMMTILAKKFSLSEQQINTLHEQARTEQDHASSLQTYTRVIHEQFTPEQKFELVVNMWEVAYADGELDKYEEHIIRRVSELLYVSHTDFIRAKHQARPS